MLLLKEQQTVFWLVSVFRIASAFYVDLIHLNLYTELLIL